MIGTAILYRNATTTLLWGTLLLPVRAADGQRGAANRVTSPNYALAFIDALRTRSWSTVFAQDWGIQQELDQRKRSVPRNMWPKITDEVFAASVNWILSGNGSSRLRDLGQWVWFPHNANLVDHRQEEFAFRATPGDNVHDQYFVEMTYSAAHTSPLALISASPGLEEITAYVRSITLKLSFDLATRQFIESEVVPGSQVPWPLYQDQRILGLVFEHAGMMLIVHVANLTEAISANVSCGGRSLGLSLGRGVLEPLDFLRARFFESLFPDSVNVVQCELLIARENDTIDRVRFEATRGRYVCWVRQPWFSAVQWRESTPRHCWFGGWAVRELREVKPM